MSTIFISHAAEDKDAVARPLAEALRSKGYDVWYDEYSLKLGDSLRRGMDAGLAKSSFGIVVLSHAFFAKEWPQKELDALTAREAAEGNKLILPVWHRISAQEIGRYSPMLADKLGASTSEGLPPVIDKIIKVIGPPENPTKSVATAGGIVHSFNDQNVLDWKAAIQNIFPETKPTSSYWTALDDIVRVLGHVTARDLNHTFFPDGGGMDLMGAAKSLENDCIELRWSRRYASIVKPKILQFESFTGFPSLSYFRLETNRLEPWTENFDSSQRLHEELAEVFPMDYRERSVLDAGYYGYDENGDEIPTPKNSRVITRYFGGSFVIFAKGSAYNGLKGKHDAYNGQHNKLSASEFRKFIADVIREAASREIELEPDRR